jgi:transcriptional regulator with XRE-family HTH domain
MQQPANPWRAWRETIAGLTMNEVARRAGISSGRLSIVERGVMPTDEEAAKLRAVLIEASNPKGEVS